MGAVTGSSSSLQPAADLQFQTVEQGVVSIEAVKKYWLSRADKELSESDREQFSKHVRSLSQSTIDKLANMGRSGYSAAEIGREADRAFDRIQLSSSAFLEGCQSYQQNKQATMQKMQTLNAKIRTAVNAIDFNGFGPAAAKASSSAKESSTSTTTKIVIGGAAALGGLLGEEVQKKVNEYQIVKATRNLEKAKGICTIRWKDLSETVALREAVEAGAEKTKKKLFIEASKASVVSLNEITSVKTAPAVCAYEELSSKVMATENVAFKKYVDAANVVKTSEAILAKKVAGAVSSKIIARVVTGVACTALAIAGSAVVTTLDLVFHADDLGEPADPPVPLAYENFKDSNQ